MKIRNHKKTEYLFYPHEKSKLLKGEPYRFKRKQDLMRFLNNNFDESLNGEVYLDENSFYHSAFIREWQVWFNDYKYYKHRKQKGCNISMQIELKPILFRNHKSIFSKGKIKKSSKVWMAFAEKVSNRMLDIYEKDNSIKKEKAQSLVKLFYKQGFVDFKPDTEDQEYIDFYIKEGIDFMYWSDRCNSLRKKTIIEYFKKEGLID